MRIIWDQAYLAKTGTGLTVSRLMKCPTSKKSVHFTAEAAERAAAHCQGRAAKPLRTYQCPTCRYWHLTKRRQWPPPERTSEEMFQGLANRIKEL